MSEPTDLDLFAAQLDAQLAKLTPAEQQAALGKLTPELRAALQDYTRSQLWSRGDLRYKLHATQLKIDAAITASKRRRFFLLCSRRTGKTYYLLSRLFARALSQRGARLLYLAPYARDAAEIANDLAVHILADCPPHLRPEYNAQNKEFNFKSTGSIVRLKGVNSEHHNQLRGGATHEIVLDECGQIDNLRSIVNSVCMPMTLTTGGLILYATTPPESAGHDSRAIYEELAQEQSAVKFTLLDTPHVPYAEKFVALRELGESEADVIRILAGECLPKTTAALREYFCRFVTDSSMAVVPEFTEEARNEICVERQRPEYYTPYVSMDPGSKDKTGILFAHWDFLHAKLVIEDELLLSHPGTPDIAREIKAVEDRLWAKDQFEPRRFLDSSGDGGQRLINDMRSLHQLQFKPARKDNSMAAVHLMRHSVGSRELVIHPRCVHLIRQLENAIWNNKATDFAREGQGEMQHHQDLLAALKYLVRSVDRTHNPFPDNFYAMGGRLGLPVGSWVSPKNKNKRDDGPGLYGTTPTGKRLAKASKKRRH